MTGDDPDDSRPYSEPSKKADCKAKAEPAYVFYLLYGCGSILPRAHQSFSKRRRPCSSRASEVTTNHGFASPPVHSLRPLPPRPLQQ
jgi:hypothetical protein